MQTEKDPCLQEYQRAEERREELKQQIALLATRLLQDPEQHVRDLPVLVQLARDRDELVSLLADVASPCLTWLSWESVPDLVYLPDATALA